MIMVAFALWSTAFGNGDMIPALYTIDGEDISPPLEWICDFDVESFALICEDPDAPVGNWIHWVIYNIPGEQRELEEGIPSDSQLVNGIVQGNNSWGEIGYRGPAPPFGKHRYFFTIYALEGHLHLAPGATAEELREAMEGNIIQQVEFMGEYSRESNH